MVMTPEDALRHYLHQHIPLSAAMQVNVERRTNDNVVLTAPLQPNINHRDSVFGGSASALAILSAWSLVNTRLSTAAVSARLVIQRNKVEYTRPILGAFSASATLRQPERWDLFLKTLDRRGRARIVVDSMLSSEGHIAGTFEGEFVAMQADATQ
jgi:thioesterase domain-containing protein